jgi:hypothetical protein
MPTACDQAVAMHALCLAFPFLKICRGWSERIALIEDAMHLTVEERKELAIEAAGVSGRMTLELAK